MIINKLKCLKPIKLLSLLLITKLLLAPEGFAEEVNLPRLSTTTINNIIGVKKTIERNRELEQKHIAQMENDRDNINTIKIISLAPNITENLFYLGLGNNIVGVDALSDYPSAVQSIPKVATVGNIDYEEILNLKPDLIVVWNDFFPHLEKDLASYKIPAKVFRFNTHRISDFGDAILRLGLVTHTEERAIEIKEAFNNKFKELRNTYMNYPSHTVAYIIWDEPIYTVGENSWINDLIEICNGKNPFKNSDIAYPIIDQEYLLAVKPEIIVNATIAHPMLNIPPILHENTITLNKVNGMHRISRRTMDSASELCKIIHAKDQLIDEDSSSKELDNTDPTNESINKIANDLAPLNK